MRAVSVPLGITTPNEPNISSTLWRTVSDQKNLVYYFELGHPSQHLLGVARQARPEARRAGQETHHPERRGVLGRGRRRVQGCRTLQVPAGDAAIGQCGSASTSAAPRSKASCWTTAASSGRACACRHRRTSYEATVAAVAGVVRELEAQVRRALPGRRRPSRRAVAGHRPDQERQFDPPERPSARPRPESARSATTRCAWPTTPTASPCPRPPTARRPAARSCSASSWAPAWAAAS